MSESADTRFGAAEIAAMSSSEIAELWRWVDRQLEDGRSRWHWQVEDGAEGARLVPHGDHGDEHDPGPALRAWALVLAQAGRGDERARYALGEVSRTTGEMEGLRALARRMKEARPTWRMPPLPTGEEGAEHARWHRRARLILETHEFVCGTDERTRRTEACLRALDERTRDVAEAVEERRRAWAEALADDRNFVEKDYWLALGRGYFRNRVQTRAIEAQIRELEERLVRLEAKLGD